MRSGQSSCYCHLAKTNQHTGSLYILRFSVLLLDLCTGLCEIAKPLHNLTRKNATLNWDKDCEEAFLGLKEWLTSAPILVPLHDEGQYVLDTDASDMAFGTVLQQEQGGQLHVFGYASHTLTLTNLERLLHYV